MNRSIIIATASALLLSACSGSKEPAPEAKPAAAAKKGGGKEAAHVNPWAKDAPAQAPAFAAKDEPAQTAGAGTKANPWAKDPPPGSEPVEQAKPVPNKKK